MSSGHLDCPAIPSASSAVGCHPKRASVSRASSSSQARLPPRPDRGVLAAPGVAVNADEAANVAWRVGVLEKTIAELEGKVDRLVWALVLLSVSIAGSTLTYVLTAAAR